MNINPKTGNKQHKSVKEMMDDLKKEQKNILYTISFLLSNVN